MKKSLLTLIVLAAFVRTAIAAPSNNTSTPVGGKVRIFAPITLVNTSGQPLDFGVIAKGVSTSVIVVSPEDNPPVNVSSGDAVVVSSSPQTAARFTVGGEPDQAYIITIPLGGETISDGTNELDLTNFTCSKLGNNGVIGSSGSDEFYVGATLTILSTTIAGEYTGTFNVTVAYE
jgi:hypothetical protein